MERDGLDLSKFCNLYNNTTIREAKTMDKSYKPKMTVDTRGRVTLGELMSTAHAGDGWWSNFAVILRVDKDLGWRIED